MNGEDLKQMREVLRDFQGEHQRYLDAKFKSLEEIVGSHRNRIDSLEKKRFKDTSVSGITGFVGGFIAVFTKEFWLK